MPIENTPQLIAKAGERFLKVGKRFSGKLTKKYMYDAGQDIHSAETILVPAKDSVVVKTNLRIAVPVGCVGLVWSRSGLSMKHDIEVGAGCIDSDYRGEVLIHLYNHGEYDYTINKGDKIAQLLTIPVNLNPYEKSIEIDETARGEDGFGSTGI